MIVEAMRAMVARLEAAGIRACLDERDLAPPGVMVLPPAVAYRRLRGGGEAGWRLIVAVPDSGAGTAIDTLSEFVEQVRAALDYEITAAIPTTVTVTEGPPVPAYRLELNTDI